MQREDAMNPRRPPPRILLVEDDPTTSSYLQALLETLPAEVKAAGNLAAALRASDDSRFDLLLVDARLPDGSGPDVLAGLRERGVESRALAHTAANEAEALQPLLDAGFLEVLSKPVEPATWLATLRRHLALLDVTGHDSSPRPTRRHEDIPLWDDAIAARALAGNAAHISSLRELFMSELPGQLEALGTGGNAARDVVHRLRASCTLVGAARLGSVVESAGREPDASALQEIIAIGEKMLEQHHSIGEIPAA